MVGSPYTHLSLKIAVPRSNGSGKKNYIKVHLLDMSRGRRVFAIEFYYKVWYRDIRGYFPEVVLPFKFFLLYQELESSPMPMAI